MTSSTTCCDRLPPQSLVGPIEHRQILLPSLPLSLPPPSHGRCHRCSCSYSDDGRDEAYKPTIGFLSECNSASIRTHPALPPFVYLTRNYASWISLQIMWSIARVHLSLPSTAVTAVCHWLCDLPDFTELYRLITQWYLDPSSCHYRGTRLVVQLGSLFVSMCFSPENSFFPML